MEVRTALEAAQALIAALGIRFGEVTVQASAGEITLLRHGHTLKPEDLAEMQIPRRHLVINNLPLAEDR